MFTCKISYQSDEDEAIAPSEIGGLETKDDRGVMQPGAEEW